MLKVVLDTNVFVSGFLYGGNPKSILRLWEENKFVVCSSPQLRAEVIYILANKLRVDPHLVDRATSVLKRYSQIYQPKKYFDVFKDKKDNFLLDLVYAADADYLISGDKGVLKLPKFFNTKIITTRDFLKEVKS